MTQRVFDSLRDELLAGPKNKVDASELEARSQKALNIFTLFPGKLEGEAPEVEKRIYEISQGIEFKEADEIIRLKKEKDEEARKKQEVINHALNRTPTYERMRNDLLREPKRWPSGTVQEADAALRFATACLILNTSPSPSAALPRLEIKPYGSNGREFFSPCGDNFTVLDKGKGKLGQLSVHCAYPGFLDLFYRESKPIQKLILSIADGEEFKPSAKEVYDRAKEEYDSLPWWKKIFSDTPR